MMNILHFYSPISSTEILEKDGDQMHIIFLYPETQTNLSSHLVWCLKTLKDSIQ